MPAFSYEHYQEPDIQGMLQEVEQEKNNTTPSHRRERFRMVTRGVIGGIRTGAFQGYADKAAQLRSARLFAIIEAKR